MNELLKLFGLVPLTQVEQLHDKIIAQSEHIDLLVKDNERIRKNVTEVERSEHILNTQLTEINARLTQEIERLRLKYEPEIVEEQLQQVAANPPESVKKTHPKKGTPS